jgi:L-fuculose-phosphate aldolase
MTRDYSQLRREVCEFAKKMARMGWVFGSSGNVSARVPDQDGIYVITPTSVPYDELTPENIVVCDGEGEQVIEVDNAPSFELPLHAAVYRARPEINGIFHTHAIYSTVLSILGLPLPALIEEMVPYLGGEVTVAAYGQSGSQELATNAVKALSDRAAVLIANHGNLCVGKTLAKAFGVCGLVERAAQIYVESLKVAAAGHGKVQGLPAEVLTHEREMYEVLMSMPAE